MGGHALASFLPLTYSSDVPSAALLLGVFCPMLSNTVYRAYSVRHYTGIFCLPLYKVYSIRYYTRYMPSATIQGICRPPLYMVYSVRHYTGIFRPPLYMLYICLYVLYMEYIYLYIVCMHGVYSYVYILYVYMEYIY